jgi:hypothetical protein
MRQAGHFGINAKISEEHEDDNVAEKYDNADGRGTIKSILNRIAEICTSVFTLVHLGYCPVRQKSRILVRSLGISYDRWG